MSARLKLERIYMMAEGSAYSCVYGMRERPIKTQIDLADVTYAVRRRESKLSFHPLMSGKTPTCLRARQRNPVSGKRVGPWSVCACGPKKVCATALRQIMRGNMQGPACKLTMTWSHPDFWSMFATSFAVMGARLLSFLSWRA